jgi:predicted phosphoribosyltransferase
MGDADYPTRFADRAQAGQFLAQSLLAYADRPDVLVLALPRGGVPVAYEVAVALRLPLDVFVVRKLGVPGREELAFGAVAGDGTRVLNREVIDSLHISDADVRRVTQAELRELQRREAAYRGNRPPVRIRQRVILLIDDGLATGATMRAAVMALRQQHPAQIIISVPTASRQACGDMRPIVDDVICEMTPEPFYAVGLWYEDFSPVTDDEVKAMLVRAYRRM